VTHSAIHGRVVSHSPRWARARIGLAAGLVLLYSAASGFGRARRALEHRSLAQDEITAYEDRFQSLRHTLPSSGVVGYLGDPALGSDDGEESKQTALLHFRRYLLAQYALAPLLLVENTDPELVIGNFEPGTPARVPPGFAVARDFGDGVVLFRRLQP
jgi:hypothetical protein